MLSHCEIDDKSIKVFYDMKEQIKLVTNEKDLLIFIGNSPSYIYHTFNIYDARKCISIPISGNWFTNQPISLDKWREYFMKKCKIIDKIERVILIDFTATGSSILNFTELIKICDLFSSNIFIKNIVMLHDEHYYKTGNLKNIIDKNMLLVLRNTLKILTPPLDIWKNMVSNDENKAFHRLVPALYPKDIDNIDIIVEQFETEVVLNYIQKIQTFSKN